MCYLKECQSGPNGSLARFGHRKRARVADRLAMILTARSAGLGLLIAAILAVGGCCNRRPCGCNGATCVRPCQTSDQYSAHRYFVPPAGVTYGTPAMAPENSIPPGEVPAMSFQPESVTAPDTPTIDPGFGPEDLHDLSGRVDSATSISRPDARRVELDPRQIDALMDEMFANSQLLQTPAPQVSWDATRPDAVLTTEPGPLQVSSSRPGAIRDQMVPGQPCLRNPINQDPSPARNRP